MNFKQAVYSHCLQMMQSKIAFLLANLNDLRQSLANETKSTAGDKYETARAMLHIEQENTNRQLAEALAQLASLQDIDITAQPNRIAMGSLVHTNRGHLFISIALGKLVVADTNVVALSPQSPLGLQLMGLQAGQNATINQTTYQVLQLS